MSAAATLSLTVTPPTLVAVEDLEIEELPAPEPARGAPTLADPQERTTALPRLAFDGNKPRLLVTRERRYDILDRLGEGGVGEVFLARDQDIGRKVAIKKVASAAASRGALVRFIYEVHTIGRLEHPNIIPIHDVGQDEHGNYYFVMKYVEGLTLETIIERLRAGDAETHRRFGLEQRLAICRGVMEALAFAHAQGVVHRDIKPANVMVGEYGQVLLLDWGIALSTDPTDLAGGPREGVLIGTPLYMSPEQARRQPVDPRSDVYSLTVMMHELLTLRHYLEDLDALDAVLDGVCQRPVGLATLTRHRAQAPIPMDLTWFLHKGVHKDPNQRFPSVDAMIDRLDRRAAGEVEVECPVTLSKRVTYETVKATDRFVVPLLGPILRLWAWGLATVGVGRMVGLAVGLLGAMGVAVALCLLGAVVVLAALLLT